MLSVSKNKSKSTQAVVTFTVKRPRPRPQVLHIAPAPLPQPTPLPPRQGIQKSLTEATFRQYLGGFMEIQPVDIPLALGKRIRYALDTFVRGRLVKTDYRLGGIVTAVANGNATLFNPYAKKTWNLKIQQPPNKRLRLYVEFNKNVALR